ncbi:malic-domain-containing protein [Microthyrium microscopicum]|uniref:Malic enzyme n=1 Tax=Microthyrium microscopicum TaxID=703497 RepID=A0A6A6UAP7_9PEZI|nr:malic-domain-containing protein [Microthyrium microscopicum]
MDPGFKQEKHPFWGELKLSTSGRLECALSGLAVLRHPYFNKGSAFTAKERTDFELHGLLPPHVQTLQEQEDDLAKNSFMNSMRVQNEVLFYRLILDHLKEMFPIIYTPTEGEAIEKYSSLFRRPEGCFLNIDDADRIETDLSKFGLAEEVDLIVVSDGEQILGIGDQGVGGILISVAKLMLYTICSGVNPARTLPVVLDAGTNNEDLLKDPLYLGLPKSRVRGEKYDNFVDSFIQAAKKLYPKAYIHFEDFGLQNARRILDRYQPKIACFNDDVQGTGCVTLAGIMAANHITGNKMADIRVVMFGAGTAGTGIADQLRDAIAVESKKDPSEAAKQIWCVDKIGVLLESKKDKLTNAQLKFAQEDKNWKGDSDDLLGVIKAVKPHVLIGTSTKPGAFTEEIVKEMAKHVERPVIFPLSNPTRLHEAKPEDLMKWTDCKALVATGSPFPPVKHNRKEYEIAECNNSVCFPGIGLGAILSRTKLMPAELLVEATKAVAAAAPVLKDPQAGLLPDVSVVRDVSVDIAAAVIKKAVELGLAQETDIPEDDAVLKDWIREQMWDPVYRELLRVDEENASPHAKGEVGSNRTH